MTLERLRASLADRYRLERKLGQGGMATVYLAEDLKHHRPVAIKVLKPELAAAIGAERFLREIETIASLQHPHILGLLDSGEADGLGYYVMPFVDGESLRDRLTRERQLPVREAVRLATEVAGALDYAHLRGIVHRDIKPENILLHDGVALVADFGIALASGAGGARLTETGMLIGTPHYMSPEQAAGDRIITARSDIYSVGCLLYEMLLGEPPFTGPNAQAILVRIVTEQPPSLTTRRDTIPPGVEDAVLTALQKLPADRFATAGEFSAALAEGPARRGTPSTGHRLESGRFCLSEEVCRRLSRRAFDPRLIGGDLEYLDNHAASDVLVCYIASIGRGAEQFTQVLQHGRHRGVAPTFRGFEAGSAWRPALGLEDHQVLIREFLRAMVARLQPRLTIVAGFSSGGDFAIRFAAAPDPHGQLQVQGCLTLGANLALETCFFTRVLAGLDSNDDDTLLAGLRGVANAVTSLDEWVDICEYVARIVPMFRHDLAPLRVFAADFIAPFQHEALTPFAQWYREATARGCRIRAVFEDTAMYRDLVRDLQLRNLDQGLLGPHYEEQSVVSEAATNHFDLLDPARVARHVDALVSRLDRAMGPWGGAQ